MEELVSTAGTLTFDPANDVQVLREFDFDEVIQRPEEIRFFTLAEQTADYMEKILPKTPIVPKAVLRRAEHEVDSMKDLYQRILKATPEGYEMVPPARPESLPWVYPYSKETPAYQTYSFDTTWSPLFATEDTTYANILDSLPKHIFFPGSLQRYAVTDKTQFFSKGKNQFVTALGEYPYNKTAYREDGSFRIQTVKRPGTADTASYDGWRIDPPPMDFPNPLEDNPFLNRRTDPVYMDTEEPLPTLLPSVDLIFEHAVPSTTHPYKEASSAIKLWDVRMQDIPWSIWKNKFQPVDPVTAPPTLEELKPPTQPGEEAAPSKSLQDQYAGAPWYPALSSWTWLSKQVDGGQYLGTLYLANVGTQEPIAIPPPLQDPNEGLLPSGTAEDCLPTHVDSFEDFAVRGVFRPGTGQSLKEDEPGWKGTPVCLPLSFLEKEKEDAPYKGRKPWLPDTATNILSSYRALLSERAYKEDGTYKGPKYARAKAPEPVNQTRAKILAIEEDEDRTDEDKARDIRMFLRSIVTPEPKFTEFQYFDGTTSTFLVCEHTLRQLEGDYARDPDSFRKQWGAEELGSMNCRYCGEQIERNVFVQQNQFDESGRVIGTVEALPTRKIFTADHSTYSFVQSLADLAGQFNPKSPAEDLMFLLLSLIQVIPDPDKLKPVLDYVRREVEKIEALIVAKKLDAKKTADARFLEAILGFNGTVILLQIHDPPLVPRRSVGSKPLSLRGYPRDTSDINDAPLVDGLIAILRKMFDEYPSTFKGSSVGFLRVLLQNPGSLKEKLFASMNKQVIPYFKTVLVSAAERTQPERAATTTTVNSFEPPFFRFDRTDFMPPAAQLKDKDIPNRSVCKDLIPGWTSATRVYSSFVETKIVQPILPGLGAELVRKDVEDVPVRQADTAEIRRRIKLGLPKQFPSATYTKIAALEDPVLLQACLEIVLDTLGSLTNQNFAGQRAEATTTVGDPSLLRDLYKGILYELAQGMDKPTAVNLERSLSKNMALRTLTTSAASAKAMRDRLRAVETENYKRQLRQMTDVKRDVIKRLQDLHIGVQLITKEDREEFMRELAAAMEEQQVLVAEGEEVVGDIPEEGLNVERDVGEQGDDVVNQDGEVLENDYGDYGDRRARTADGEELPPLEAFDFDEGYGS